MRKAPAIIFGLLVLLIVGRFVYGLVAAPSDKALISQALQEAIDGSKQGRTGSLIDLISSKLQVNGMKTGTSRIAEFVKKSKPEVILGDEEPVIAGNTAQITSDATVTVNLGGFSKSFQLHKVTLQFTKESGTDWLIFPSKKWRLTDVSFPADEIPDIDFGGGMGLPF